MEKNKESINKARRALIHILSGIFIISLTLSYSNSNLLLLGLLILGVILSLLSTTFRIPVVCWLLNNCELKRAQKFPGKSSLFFLAGSLLVLVLFEKNISLASISILTFADPVAHYASKLTSKTRRRSILGVIAAIIVASLVSLPFIKWEYALSAAIVSMLAEATVIRIWEDTVDDNFLIPLVAGITVYISMAIF